MALGTLAQLGMLGLGIGSAVSGGKSYDTSSVPRLNPDQTHFLRDLALSARSALGTGAEAPPSGFAPISPMQGQGLSHLGGLPAQLQQGMGIAGQGQQTLGRMLDPARNMQYAQQMFEPIQDRIANRFASVDGARSSGFGQALGRGFAQGVMPQIYGQQAQALSQAPQMAGLPMDLQLQAAGGLLGGGGLERQAQLQELQDAQQRWSATQPYNNPMLRLGLQSAGVPLSDTVVSQQMSPGAALAQLTSSPGVWDFLGGLGQRSPQIPASAGSAYQGGGYQTGGGSFF
jgi:hypothetical protein